MTRKTNASVFIFSLLLIATTVASQELPVKWDSLLASSGYGLTISNHGNAGNSGIGGVNLDYVGPGVDCTIGELNPADVYLYDLTPIIMQSQTNYSWQPYWSEEQESDHNFIPMTDPIGQKMSQRIYRSNQFITSDSALGCLKHWFLVVQPDRSVIMMERWLVYSLDGADHLGVRLGELVDWNIPSDDGLRNSGDIVSAEDYAWLSGIESHSDQENDCLPADSRYGISGLMGYFYSSEFQEDFYVNHTGLAGLQTLSKNEIFSPADSLLPDTLWNRLNETGFSADFSGADQIMLINYGQYDIIPGDTLVLWTMHASIHWGSQSITIPTLMANARAWYNNLRDQGNVFTCCGTYTGGYPGNTNFGSDGKRGLADITVHIDHVYIGRQPLYCMENGDLNFDGKVNLADITRLIDHVYMSKKEFNPCVLW